MDYDEISLEPVATLDGLHISRSHHVDEEPGDMPYYSVMPFPVRLHQKVVCNEGVARLPSGVVSIAIADTLMDRLQECLAVIDAHNGGLHH